MLLKSPFNAFLLASLLVGISHHVKATVREDWTQKEILDSLVPFLMTNNTLSVRGKLGVSSVSKSWKAGVIKERQAILEFQSNCINSLPMQSGVFETYSRKCLDAFGAACGHFKSFRTLKLVIPDTNVDEQDNRDHNDIQENGNGLFLTSFPWSAMVKALKCPHIQRLSLQVSEFSQYPGNVTKNARRLLDAMQDVGIKQLAVEYPCQEHHAPKSAGIMNYLAENKTVSDYLEEFEVVCTSTSNLDISNRMMAEPILLTQNSKTLKHLGVHFDLPLYPIHEEIANAILHVVNNPENKIQSVEVINLGHQETTLKFLCSSKLTSLSLLGYGSTFLERRVLTTIRDLPQCLHSRKSTSFKRLSLGSNSDHDPRYSGFYGVHYKYEDRITSWILEALSKFARIEKLSVALHSHRTHALEPLKKYVQHKGHELKSLDLRFNLEFDASVYMASADLVMPLLLVTLQQSGRLKELKLHNVVLDEGVVVGLEALIPQLHELSVHANSFKIESKTFNDDIARFISHVQYLKKLWKEIFAAAVRSDIRRFNYGTAALHYVMNDDTRTFEEDYHARRQSVMHSNIMTNFRECLQEELDVLLMRSLLLEDSQSSPKNLQFINEVERLWWMQGKASSTNCLDHLSRQYT